jgi:hypothetical protein
LSATENIQWQKAVIVVIAMKEPALLIAVHGIVSSIKIQYPHIGLGGIGINERFNKYFGYLCQSLTVNAVLQSA